MRQHNKVEETRKGQLITANKLTSMARAINAQTDAVARPRQKDLPNGSTGEAAAGTNTTWTAGASDITSTTVTITDSASNTHDIERIDEIVFTNAETGETMTLQITYT